MQIYNKRLDERERRRAHVVQHNLLASASAASMQGRRTGPVRQGAGRHCVCMRDVLALGQSAVGVSNSGVTAPGCMC